MRFRSAGTAVFNATVAQSVEQRTENPRVGGSIPPCGTRIHAGCVVKVKIDSPVLNPRGAAVRDSLRF